MTCFSRRIPVIHCALVLGTILTVLATSPARATTNTNWFHIVSLTTSNVVTTSASLAGILAASSNHVFASRVSDSEFRRWDADGLANQTNVPSGYIIVSDLCTEKVYALGDSNGACTRYG